MPNELVFTFVKISDEPCFRMVCQEEGQVIEIIESTSMRNCLNRQLEMLLEYEFTKEKWRVRNG